MQRREGRSPLQKVNEELRETRDRLEVLRGLRERVAQSEEFRARCEALEGRVRELEQRYRAALKEIKELRGRILEVQRERDEYKAMTARLMRDIREYNRLIDSLTSW
jgi:uncharacterized coiled-coil DUF342 family protein